MARRKKKSKANLQTIIIPKTLADTRESARELARPHARRIYTTRETGRSFRFRQRPPGDFIKNSFRTVKLPNGISMVFGKLKRGKNPRLNPDKPFSGPNLVLDFDDGTIESEGHFYNRFCGKVQNAKTFSDFQKLARSFKNRDVQSIVLRKIMLECLTKAASKKGFCSMANYRYVKDDVLAFQMKEKDFDRCLERLLRDNPAPRKKNNNKTTKKKTSKKKSTKKKPSYIKLRSPKIMPDPGPCAVLGESREFKWRDGKQNAMWSDGHENWMFLWSPKYKAVVAIKKPKRMKKLPNISRKGGAARAYKRFMARDPKNTYEIEMEAYPLKKVGKACHYVYWSDKWHDDAEYIHELGKGVELYCGPSKKNPEVFLCVGGKLTLTERGLVF